VPPPSIDDDLTLAFQLGDLAAEVALEFFARGVDTVWKEDNTPVSEADLEVDRRLLEALLVARPADAVLSEESGARGSSSRRWILDPIDGTFNFVEAKPAWGTHVALEVDGELVLGLITRPVREQRWWATRDRGAFRSSLSSSASSAIPVHVSAVDDIAKSRVSVWSIRSDEVVERLERETVMVEATLDNILEVIDGDHEAVVGAAGKIWDHAPAVIIIAEAGGHFRDGQGGHRPDLGSGIYSNRLIDSALDQVIEG
jgi:histidinol-phosphatase